MGEPASARDQAPPHGLSRSRRWAMLAVSMLSQAASAFFCHGVAFLIPALQRDHGLTLVQAGLVVAMPIVGVMLTLIAWSALADRFGERSSVGHGIVSISAFLLLGGMAAASTAAASGRVVVGWFAREHRGLAMGVRQMAQPLGVGAAAVAVPRSLSSRAAQRPCGCRPSWPW